LRGHQLQKYPRNKSQKLLKKILGKSIISPLNAKELGKRENKEIENNE